MLCYSFIELSVPIILPSAGNEMIIKNEYSLFPYEHGVCNLVGIVHYSLMNSTN